MAQLAWFPVAMRRGSACLLLFLGLAWPKRNSQSLVAWHGFPERHWKAHGRVPALRSFYGDSVPVPPPGHPDYPVGAEVQPFANQNGGVDDTIAPPRLYMSHSCTWEVFAQPSLGLGLKETGMVQRQAPWLGATRWTAVPGIRRQALRSSSWSTRLELKGKSDF